jgi:hypothetical protein
MLRTGHPHGLLAANDRMLGMTGEEDLHLVLREDRPIAVLRLSANGDRLTLYEATCEDAAAAGRAWEAVRRLADTRGCRELRCRLPPTCPIARAAGLDRPHVGGNGEFLVKVLSWSALPGVAKTLEHRVEESASPGWRGALTIRTDRGLATVGRSSGRVAISVRTGDSGGGEEALYVPDAGLLRALVGRDRLGDMVRRRYPARPDLAGLLDVLFPPGQPWFWLADAI